MDRMKTYEDGKESSESIKISGSQVGVVGRDVHVEGGIHYHYYEQIPHVSASEVRKDSGSSHTRCKLLKVFLCYAEEDIDMAEKLYGDLKQAGVTVWIDAEDLPAGANKRAIISREIRESRYFIALLSSKSLTAGGFVQREMKMALDILDELPDDDIFIIPVRADNCEPMEEKLRRLQTADLFPCYEKGLAKILRTLQSEKNFIAEPKPYADPSSLILPGGAVESESPFYIRRTADEEVFRGVSRSRGLVTIRAPRQTGKTSLMMQIFTTVRKNASLRPVFVDFQAFANENFASLNAIWYAILSQTDAQMKTECRMAEICRPDMPYDRNLSVFLDKFVFRQDDTPVLLCLDEVDRVFSTQIKGDFFSSLRAFYNRGAIDPAWKKIRWLLSTSSEPAFFIEDLNQSLFNIGLQVELNAFTREETAEFAKKHGISPDHSLMERITDYLGGRPYPVHLLLYHMALFPQKTEQFFHADSAGGGIFLEHLNRYLKKFQKEPELATAMKRVIAGKGCTDVKMEERLASAGLVKREANQNVICFCKLYADYFGKRIV